MKRKHTKMVDLIFHRPVSANVKFDEVVLFGEVRVLHKPHPSPNMDKGAVAALRDWLEQQGVTP